MFMHLFQKHSLIPACGTIRGDNSPPVLKAAVETDAARNHHINAGIL